MASIADLDLSAKRDQVLDKLKHGPVWIFGPSGSGRSELSRALAEALDAVLVEPPGLEEVDAALHALVQCALDEDSTRLAFDERLTLLDRARRLAQRLAAKHKTLIVRLPNSWSFESAGESANDQRRKNDIIQVVRGWGQGNNDLVLLTSTLEEESALTQLMPSSWVKLQRASIRREALEDGGLWGTYRTAAKQLHIALVRQGIDITPLQARLAVALVAHGVSVSWVLGVARQRSTPFPLAERLRDTLMSKAPKLWTGLQAVASARFPLATSAAVRLAGLNEDDQPLLTQCVGYGDGQLRIPEPVRDVLRAEHEKPHVELAWHYQQVDGALSPMTLVREKAVAWLEKAHHLAHVSDVAVPAGRQRWSDLDCPARHLLWDRARFLSKTLRQYGDAAELYRKCISSFGDDDYSWHYLGFNLDRINANAQEVEEALRQAVQPTWPNGAENSGERNPWWSSRLVTHLIKHGRFTAAQSAWGQAIDAIDPDRKRVAENPWLARHLHKWIVREWLNAGEVAQARAVFDEIPRAVIESEEVLRQLRWRLEDAEEAVQLTESVYPASTQISSRWVKPQVDVPVQTWSPGRVVSASDESVVLVMAAPGANGPEQKVIRVELAAEEWKQMAPWCEPASARGFVELHILKSGEKKIVPVTASDPPWSPASGQT